MKLVKSFEILAGNSQLLGANFDGEGVNFALFSARAERVEPSSYFVLFRVSSRRWERGPLLVHMVINLILRRCCQR